MKCGSPHHPDGYAEISIADYALAWDEIRAWRAANPLDVLDENKVRTAVRDALLPKLPAPRADSSNWWMMLCILTADWAPNPPIAWDENRWVVWAYFLAIPPDKRIGDRPLPGEDFDPEAL